MRAIVLRYHVFQALVSLRMFAPVLLLLYTEHGLGLGDVALLQALFSVVIIAVDVPAGVLADTVGHRWSLVAGALVFGASLVVLALGTAMGDFVVSEGLGAVGLALMSGADKSLLYAALPEEGRDHAFAGIEGRARGIGAACQSAGAVAGGMLGGVALVLPVGLSAGAAVLAAAVAAGFPARHPRIAIAPRQRGETIVLVREGWGLVRGSKRLRRVIARLVVLGTAQWAGFWLLLPLLVEHGSTAVDFGLVLGAVCAAVFVASHWVGWAIRRGGRGVYDAAGLATTVALAVVALGGGLWVLPMFAVVSWLEVVVSTAATLDVLAEVPRERSATVLSMMTMARRACYAMVIAVVGWASGELGVGAAAGLVASIWVLDACSRKMLVSLLRRCRRSRQES